MGSVKDLEIQNKATREGCGRARFLFSNRYSVFDWGEMPDSIPHKGEAICILSSYFFERLEEMGIPTHYCGLIEDGKLKRLSSLKKPTNIMEIKLVRVLKPEIKDGNYDYSIYKKEHSCFLIPLEVIYRNYLSDGSSVFKRLKEGQITLFDLGLKEEPKADQRLPKPICDFSTKLEITDRYLSLKEAIEISGLSEMEMRELKRITMLVNNLITEEFSKIGLLNEDGKIEFGFDEKRDLMVVDVLGTLDECRLSLNGLPISKEIARIYYKKTPWYALLEEAKKIDRENFKGICEKPEPLPDRLKLLISQLYCAVACEITKDKWFDVPPLEEIAKEIRGYV